MTAPYQSRAPVPRGADPVATYVYEDEGRRPLFRVLRYEWTDRGQPKKTFRAQRFLHHVADGVPKWANDLGDARRVLYRLPELRAAIAGGVDPIYVVEGEKDVETLRALGLAATTAPFGAGKWVGEYAACLHGARRVVVIQDVDGPANRYAGQRHARAVEESLERAGIPTLVVQPATGKDITEALAARKAAP